MPKKLKLISYSIYQINIIFKSRYLSIKKNDNIDIFNQYKNAHNHFTLD